VSVEEAPFKPRPLKEWLSFMAGLCIAAGDMKKAEGYMLELLSCMCIPLAEEAQL
jgi:hypothetical protein